MEQGPDLRYLRRAIWKGRDFLEWGYWFRFWIPSVLCPLELDEVKWAQFGEKTRCAEED